MAGLSMAALQVPLHPPLQVPSLEALADDYTGRYLLTVVYVTLRVSLTAVAISAVVSLALAVALGFGDFPGRRVAVTVVNTGMGFPSVVVGLGVLLLLSNAGPVGGGFALGTPLFEVSFGGVDLLFTQAAMVCSQVVLATPVITSVALSAIEGVDQTVRDAALAAGASRRDVQLTVLREARYGVVTGVLAGFGRAVSEVGSVLIVGGNLVGSDGTSYTRTLTTAITVEARRGNFEVGIALGGVLLVLALGVNVLGSFVRERGDAAR